MGFLDTDAMVEAAHGPIPGIFAQHGEAVFRQYELAAAHEAANTMNAVISTGGGMVQTEAAIQSLLQTGVAVYVDRPMEILLRETETEGRPLLASGREALVALYERRHPLYNGFADIVAKNTSNASACADIIVRKLEEYRK
jgi:shikimate kinase